MRGAVVSAGGTNLNMRNGPGTSFGVLLKIPDNATVEVGAANLVNPYICRDIIRDLPRVMEKYRITALKDIIGGAN